ncbi:MAG: dTMP kinase [Anaerolineales bacterium]|jgi:dTMP kinase
MFITLEGSEGSGKTSQLPALARLLKKSGYNVLTTREPGGTLIGDQIRVILSDQGNTAMSARAESLLFMAARAQLVAEVVQPHLQTGGIVISDRYAESTLAYQGYGRQLDLQQLRVLLDFATYELKPDLILLLDIDVEEGLRRRMQGGDLNRLDILEVEFYQRVRRGYLEMAAADSQRWVIVDAQRSPDQVQADIGRIVLELLKKQRG